MNNVIAQMLEFFGIVTVPTDFPAFCYWFCSLMAGINFCKFAVGTCFNFVERMNEVRK